MSLNTPTQTFSNAENFIDSILQDAKAFDQEVFGNFEFTKEEKDFLISQVEKYNNTNIRLAEMQAMIADLDNQNFDEKRSDLMGQLIATRFIAAINE